MKYLEINDPVLNCITYYYIATTLQEVIDNLKSEFKNITSETIDFNDVRNDCDGCVFSVDIDISPTYQPKRFVVVLLSDDVPTLAHELLHLVRMIFDDRGVPFNSDNDEMIAYYLEFYYRYILNAKQEEYTIVN